MSNNNPNKIQLLQDPFLNALRKEHIPVSIYLVNGIKLQGNICLLYTSPSPRDS